MKILHLFPIVLFLGTSLLAFEYKVNLGVEGISYTNYANEILTNCEADLSFENEYFTTNARGEFVYSSRYEDRRYILLNELYITKEFDDYVLSVGKKIKYWGELEGYNIADIYNQKNYLKDPFDKSTKYGALGADITRYFDENSLELGIKFYEENISYPEENTPYSPFTINYNKELQLSDKRYTPSFYLGINLVEDRYLESEIKLILLHGYDTKRNIIPSANFSLSQYAYRVNKALLLSHLIYSDMIFKTELAYTNVVDYTPMSDYTQLSFAVEKSFYELMGSDITLYGEYYRYLYADDSKVKNVDISEIYDNDLFVALRVSFNDTRSSELKVGILEDIEKNERVVKMKFHSRVVDSFILSGEYLYIRSNTTNTLLSQFDNSSRFIFAINYTF